MFVEHKEVGEVTESPAKTLTLSEAIRIGARLRPQARVYWFVNGASCALGAAYEAITGETLPEGQLDVASCGRAIKVMPKSFGTHQGEIGAKNDDGWTRERIADWLEAQGL